MGSMPVVSPYKLNREVFAAQKLTTVPAYGPLSWSVPGCVSGWECDDGKFGSQPLAQLWSPSIQTAEEGFPIAEAIATNWRPARRTRQMAILRGDLSSRWQTGPQTRRAFQKPAHRRDLSELAKQGEQAFYRGAIADKS